MLKIFHFKSIISSFDEIQNIFLVPDFQENFNVKNYIKIFIVEKVDLNILI